MGRVKTFTNGGSLLPGDLNSIEDDYELAFSSYRTLARVGGVMTVDQAAATGLWFCTNGSLRSSPATVLSPLQDSLTGGLWLDDADYGAGTRTIKLRVRGQIAPNATAPVQTFTFGLYPVTFAGAADQSSITLGAVVAGSTAPIASPVASTVTQVASADFTIPSDGFYALGVALSGTLTNNCFPQLFAQLQVHQL